MKKIILGVVTMIGLGIASTAMAAPEAFSGSATVTHGTGGDCTLLAETVTLNASAKVQAAWQCDEITGVIKIASCHEGGSRSPVVCAEVMDDSTPPEVIGYNADGCNASNVGETSTVPDYKAFAATNRGGTVSGRQLGGRCTDATLTSLGFWTE